MAMNHFVRLTTRGTVESSKSLRLTLIRVVISEILLFIYLLTSFVTLVPWRVLLVYGWRDGSTLLSKASVLPNFRLSPFSKFYVHLFLLIQPRLMPPESPVIIIKLSLITLVLFLIILKFSPRHFIFLFIKNPALMVLVPPPSVMAFRPMFSFRVKLNLKSLLFSIQSVLNLMILVLLLSLIFLFVLTKFIIFALPLPTSVLFLAVRLLTVWAPLFILLLSVTKSETFLKTRLKIMTVIPVRLKKLLGVKPSRLYEPVTTFIYYTPY